VRDPHRAAASRGKRLLERHDALLVGLLDAERADLGPPQRDAVAAERVGDRPDVGPRPDVEVERGDAVPVRDELEARGRASTRVGISTTTPCRCSR
jgi:aminoglycoside phosphotransferase (APT) family kinase protein